MKRLTTDNPQGNFETMLNYAYEKKDGAVALRCGHDEEEVDLCEFVAKEAAKIGCICSAEDIEAGACFGCLEDCLPDILDTVACQAAILRARLKMYEDTNLMPDEVLELKAMLQGTEGKHSERWQRLQELEAADEEGRLTVRPFKVGGTVWTNIAVRGDRYRSSDRPYPVKVVFIGDGSEGNMFFHVQYSNGRVFPFDESDIGKRVFLTREEAEKALKKMNERNE